MLKNEGPLLTSPPTQPVVQPELELAPKLACLRSAESYPETTRHVVPIETHFSWVFLTDRLVYKLKKPLRANSVDFTTLEKRGANCDRELRLNRRLAADVYLRVIPLTCDENETVRIDGPGVIIDWLLVMRRLPEERMLDVLLRTSQPAAGAVHELATRLAQFYAAAPRIAWRAGHYGRWIGEDLAKTHAELAAARYHLAQSNLASVAAEQQRMLGQLAPVLEQRARAGRIVEGHGDLRPEHVCLESPPVVIDCLEFDRRLRMLDPLDDLGYLALECDRLGGVAVGRAILDRYCAVAGDHPPPELIDFYQSYRAAIRARLAVRHLDDPAVSDPRKWTTRAEAYLALALQHARRAGTAARD